jgi:hypothetical protein
LARSVAKSLAGLRDERVARWVVGVATVWFAIALCWGMFGRIGAGHTAVVAARAIVAENMTTWGIWGPLREYTATAPTPNQYYLHHPWGSFWYIGLVARVLGRHAWVPRLAAIALSVSTPPLLYGVGRRLWGPAPGALSALAYVVLPITLSFGDFPGFEVPLIFGVLLATWGYVRFAERWQPGWAAVSLLGVLVSVNADWEAGVFVAVVAAMLAIAHLLVPARWFGRVPLDRFAPWWALAVMLTAGTVLGYIAYFHRIDGLQSLLDGFGKRARGNEVRLAELLRARHTWIDEEFTPLAIALGKAAAPLFLVRWVFFRRVLEAFPLAILASAGVEYVVFKQAADVHVYWPMPFAPYFALSVGMLSSTACAVVRWALARPLARAPRSAGLVGLVHVAFGVAVLAILPDGLAWMGYARRTGGRLNERGHLTLRETDKEQALEWMAARMAPEGTVVEHSGMHGNWSQSWALHRFLFGTEQVPAADGGSPRYFVADLAFLSSDQQLQLARRSHATAVGRYVLVDRQAPPAPADAFGFDERQPGPLQWYFVSGIDPVRTIRADAWSTWELRAHWGQVPNPAPDATPQSAEELRIAHNVAVAEGDDARAEALRARLGALLAPGSSVRFDDGTSLLGTRYVDGVAPVLEVYFVAREPLAEGTTFQIDAQVVRKPRWSLVPPDDQIKETGVPFAVPPRLWKPGFIYVEQAEIAHRPGVEAFRGHFASPASAPRPAGSSPWTDLLTLP